jgi:hypothetical protein
VPVVYGGKYAARIAWVGSLVVFGFAMAGPVVQLLGSGGSVNSLVLCRRLFLASVGSLAQMRRYWNVVQTEGQDPQAVDVAVREGLLSMVLLLASFI